MVEKKFPYTSVYGWCHERICLSYKDWVIQQNGHWIFNTFSIHSSAVSFFVTANNSANKYGFKNVMHIAWHVDYFSITCTFISVKLICG